MKLLYLATFMFFVGVMCRAQTDAVGPGRALQFDGIDDMIDLGNVYDDLALPFSVSVWVYIDATTTTTGPIIVTQDNSPVYNGFWFTVNPGTIGIEYGDGRGENLPAYRRGKSAPANVRGRWTHLAAVMKGASDVDLYVNGVNIGGSYGGSSTYPMASAYPNDVAKIGYFLTNGITYRFKGIMDELRIWNRALTETEIRESMCRRLNGDENGLIGYWNFDELSGNKLLDKSPKGYHGELKGNPTRVFSGAPVGDESVYLYSNNWTGSRLTKVSGDDSVRVSKISTAQGIHIYEVAHMPSQTGGLDESTVNAPYFGVFAAATGIDYSYDLNYTVAGKKFCKYQVREDNAVSNWIEKDIPISGNRERVEIIKVRSGETLSVDLGPDQVVCNASSTTLATQMDAVGKEFLWNTGEVSPSITVTNSGLYALSVSQGCQFGRDTVAITLTTSPKEFSLGDDKILCEFRPLILQVDHPVAGFQYTWQDNSSDPTFNATDFGLYWIKIENGCGVAVDSVRFTQADLGDYKIPNIITPNGDAFNQHFMLHPMAMGAALAVFNRWGKLVFSSPSYQNNWDGGGLPSGVYFYAISGDCLDGEKGVIKISK